jgi:NADH-quinone oxidoreductase subunit N
MIVGTLVGVAQSSVKRMLAYSSIAHGGYVLVALVAANDEGKGAILFYLLTYAVTNIGAFGVIGALEERTNANDRLRDYAGLWTREPALAGLMTIFLLSLGGFPPFGGFIAKWYVFTAAIEAGQTTLAIIGVLTSVVSVFFYLRVVVMMYMTASVGDRRPEPLPRMASAALIVAAVLVLYLGILPTQVMNWAAQSIRTIF